jgi:hypothetical protein
LQTFSGPNTFISYKAVLCVVGPTCSVLGSLQSILDSYNSVGRNSVPVKTTAPLISSSEGVCASGVTQCCGTLTSDDVKTTARFDVSLSSRELWVASKAFPVLTDTT